MPRDIAAELGLSFATVYAYVDATVTSANTATNGSALKR